MMNAPRAGPSVSVVMGVYNCARWIREAIDSVLAQTLPAREVVVVDDGSTDETPRIVESYGGIVRCLREKHRGRPHRNRGIRASRGDWVAFLDGDDFWDPRKLEAQLHLVTAQGLFWTFCETRWVDAESGMNMRVSNAPIRDGNILEALLLNNFIIASTAVVARSLFERVGYFDEGPAVAAAEDWDLWLRMAARFPAGCVRERLCTLRLHQDSFLAALPAFERVRHLETVIERAVVREPRRLGSLRTRALANVAYAAGVQAFRRQHLRDARAYFLNTLRRYPAQVSALVYIVLTLLGPAVATGVLRLKRRLLGRMDEGRI